ncbi:uncharacterized protein LOC142364672 [Opisthocomus hoazin]|uniref:uncharacterized protein LOC142364672 n=1 Tax=Opisthocomus hoazin TaxID=30419 RepID=UPI003F53666B
MLRTAENVLPEDPPGPGHRHIAGRRKNVVFWGGQWPSPRSSQRSTLPLALCRLHDAQACGAQRGPRSLPVSSSDGAEEAPEPRNSSFSWLERDFPAKTWFLKGRMTESRLKRQESGRAAQSDAAKRGRVGTVSGSLHQEKMEHELSAGGNRAVVPCCEEPQRRSTRRAIPLWKLASVRVHGRRLPAFGPMESQFPAATSFLLPHQMKVGALASRKTPL